MIGVLGGMGPLATADFFAKLVAATPAAGDEEHVPLLIQCDPRIPSRPDAILRGGASPFPMLLAGRDRLIAAGALALAMPCNTAHFWYEDLLKGCTVPFLSIVDAACSELARVAPAGSHVGLIATDATLSSGLFERRLAQLGYTPVLPEGEDMEGWILPAIALVKVGRVADGGRRVEQAVERLRSRGAGAVILACTETPVGLDAIGSGLRSVCIDATAALARRCVVWWREERGVP